MFLYLSLETTKTFPICLRDRDPSRQARCEVLIPSIIRSYNFTNKLRILTNARPSSGEVVELRRDRDSNPGFRFRNARTPSVSVRPLRHLSIGSILTKKTDKTKRSVIEDLLPSFNLEVRSVLPRLP